MTVRVLRRAGVSGDAMVLMAMAASASPAIGAAWTTKQIAGSTGFSYTALHGVSCVSASFCSSVGVAVGTTAGVYRPVHATSGAVVELWSGVAWTASPTPASSVAEAASTGVSCSSTNFCVALGSHGSGILTEIWNGARWRSQNAPAVGTRGTQLASVSCLSVHWCEAVGSSNILVSNSFPAPGRPLAEHWNGRRWIVQHPPGGNLPEDLQNVLLSGVSCRSRSFCLASGSEPHDDQGSGTPFAVSLRWTGVRWIAATRRLPEWSNLEGVSCLSAVDCFAAGQFYTGGDLGESTYKPLVERWFGGRRVRASLPGTPALVNPGSTSTDSGGLSAVSCVAGPGCTAVGDVPDGSVSVPPAVHGS